MAAPGCVQWGPAHHLQRGGWTYLSDRNNGDRFKSTKQVSFERSYCEPQNDYQCQLTKSLLLSKKGTLELNLFLHTQQHPFTKQKYLARGTTIFSEERPAPGGRRGKTRPW